MKFATLRIICPFRPPASFISNCIRLYWLSLGSSRVSVQISRGSLVDLPRNFLITSQVKRVTVAQKSVITDVTKRFPSSRNRVPIAPITRPIAMDIRFPEINWYLRRLSSLQLNQSSSYQASLELLVENRLHLIHLNTFPFRVQSPAKRHRTYP